jgi:hypothetical protein
MKRYGGVLICAAAAAAFGTIAFFAWIDLRCKSNEEGAVGSLHQLYTAGSQFPGLWVADVSGLYRIQAEGKPLAAIPRELAMADARPVPPGKFGSFMVGPSLTSEPVDCDGYLFRMVSPDTLVACAYPRSYGWTGRLTFLVLGKGEVWYKDIEGRCVELAPSDFKEAGWSLWQAP